MNNFIWQSIVRSLISKTAQANRTCAVGQRATVDFQTCSRFQSEYELHLLKALKQRPVPHKYILAEFEVISI